MATFGCLRSGIADPNEEPSAIGTVVDRTNTDLASAVTAREPALAEYDWTGLTSALTPATATCFPRA